MLFGSNVVTRSFYAVIVAFSSSLWTQTADEAKPVLMISVDAMNPHYVLHAENHASEAPFLQSLLRRSAYAESVINMVPTITNPNHVTLVTGTHPEQHGIFNNMLQDPISNSKAAQMEYGNAIRVPTLWEAAHMKGLKTANVLWPVSLGARGIDYNIPSISTGHTPADHYLLEAVSRPDGFLADLENEIGMYSPEEDEDEFAMRAAIAIIRREKPVFMTVHLSGLDEAQHHSGPDSPEAYTALKRIDSQLKQIVDTELAAYPNADVMIVSDHGFFPVSHVINLNSEFARRGILTISQNPAEHIDSWKAFSWTGGGSAVVMLHDPNDEITKANVKRILEDLQKNPANGIARVLSSEEAKAFGGTPETAFLIDCLPGYYIGRGLTTPLITSALQKGTHGFLPTHPELQSSFFIMGPTVAQGKNLGVIDMRQIAVTAAKELGVDLPQSNAAPLPISK